MREIIFLDIDGVLNLFSNSYMTASHRDNLCEPHLVKRFNYLCRKIEDIEIIISSSWRRDMESCREVLEGAGFLYWEKVAGRVSVSAFADSQKRGEQIHSWLKLNVSETFMPRVDAKIYIIDDEPDGTKEFWPNDFFEVCPAEGLSDKTVQRIIERSKL